jgi:UDP-N-acetylmuramoyl-tripeptide--D-alanyl-D-alanine ligase
MILKVLSAEKKVAATKGNFNNLIGLPYTILSLPLDIDAAVLEMGMNDLGEIYRLSQISEPDIAVITNIGKAHIGYLGSIEAIFKAKLELFNYVLENKREEAVFILNASDPMLKNWVDRDKVRHSISFSCNRNIPADVKLLGSETSSENSSQNNSSSTGDASNTFSLVVDDRETISGTSNLKGEHNLCNICCAVAVGLAIGIKASDAVSRLENIELPEMRSNLVDKAGIRYFMDCYNANPDSMLASMKTVVRKPAKRYIAVVGDMLELGDFANGLHYEAGKQLALNGYDHVFAMGYYAKDYIDGFLKNRTNAVLNDNAVSYSADEHERLKKDLKSFLKEGDVVLIKASRGVRLELVLDL